MFRTPLGTRTAVAFTSKAALVRALGPEQRWVRLGESALRALTAEDVRRTLDPGRIQPKGPDRPDNLASGESAMATDAAARRLILRRRRDEKHAEGPVD